MMQKISNISLGILAAGSLAAPAGATTVITQTFNFANDASGVKPVTLGTNPDPQFRYSSTFDGTYNKAKFEVEPGSGLGGLTNYSVEPGLPSPGDAFVNTSVDVNQKAGNRYLPLKFQINGGQHVGNAFFSGGGNFEKISYAAVPEPATWMELLAGFAMAGAAVRSRRKTATA